MIQLAWWILGCGQLEPVGAADSCPTASTLSSPEAGACLADRGTILEAEDPALDRSGGGALTGEMTPLAGRPLPHVVAVDFSGSMYGGYSRGGKPSADCPFYWTTPEWSTLMRTGPLAAIGPEDPAWALLFNRDIVVLGSDRAAHVEPGPLGPLPAPLPGREAVLSKVTGGAGSLPREPGLASFGRPGASNGTDTPRALTAAAAIFEAQPERDGILWLVTDNIIQTPGAENSNVNAQFYADLKGDPRWQVAYAYPVTQGKWLCRSTLMVYGMYYSSHLALDEAQYALLTKGEPSRLASPEMVAAFATVSNPGSPDPGHPFKLKPDYLDVVKVVFAGDVRCPVAAPGQARICEAKLRIDNLLKHRQIDSGTIRLSSRKLQAWSRDARGVTEPVTTARSFCPGAVSAQHRITSPLGPGQGLEVPVTIQVPPVEVEAHTLRDHWESANHEAFVVLGGMDATIDDLQTSMVIDSAQVADIYGVESLPEIFRNPNTDHLRSAVCISLGVNNPNWLASLLILGLVGGAGLGAAGGAWLLRPLWVTCYVDGVDRGRLRLSRLGRAEVVADGRTLARAGLGMSGAIVVKGVPPGKLVRRGDAWDCTVSEGDTPRRIELRRRKTSTRRPARDD